MEELKEYNKEDNIDIPEEWVKERIENFGMAIKASTLNKKH